jgi:hypothetical protein
MPYVVIGGALIHDNIFKLLFLLCFIFIATPYFLIKSRIKTLYFCKSECFKVKNSEKGLFLEKTYK